MTADKYDAIARELEEQWERDQVYSMKVRRDMIAAAIRQAAADEREAIIDVIRYAWHEGLTPEMIELAIRKRGEHE